MRFKRWMTVTPYEDTCRKRAAFHRKMRAEQEKLPLFAADIADHQPDEDQEFVRRANAWIVDQQRTRDDRARAWRRARARLNGLGSNVRPVVLALWNIAPYPADPVYLLDFIHGVQVGRIDLSEEREWMTRRPVAVPAPRVHPGA